MKWSKPMAIISNPRDNFSRMNKSVGKDCFFFTLTFLFSLPGEYLSSLWIMKDVANPLPSMTFLGFDGCTTEDVMWLSNISHVYLKSQSQASFFQFSIWVWTPAQPNQHQSGQKSKSTEQQLPFSTTCNFLPQTKSDFFLRPWPPSNENGGEGTAIRSTIWGGGKESMQLN